MTSPFLGIKNSPLIHGKLTFRACPSEPCLLPHEKGNGFDVVIHKGMTVYGRIVCTERKEKEEKEAATAE